MAKVIWTGLEDSGKTLEMAIMAAECLYQNAKWIKQGLPPRAIVYNCPFSDKFLNECAAKGVPTRHWKDVEELVDLKDCDLFIDEVGTYFDSRTFKDLPLDVRLWLAQASKLGVDIFGAAQDFAQVDISFRRLTTHLYQINKLVGSPRPRKTSPPVRFIWGVYTKRALDPVAYKEDTKKFASSGFVAWPHFIRREHCELYDTTKRIQKSLPPPFKHVARRCELDGCNLELYQTIHGLKHKISHV